MVQQLANDDLVAIGQLVGHLWQPLCQGIVQGQHTFLHKPQDRRRSEHLGDTPDPERSIRRHGGVVHEVCGSTCPLKSILRRVDPHDHARGEVARSQIVHFCLYLRHDIRRERLRVSTTSGADVWAV